MVALDVRRCVMVYVWLIVAFAVFEFALKVIRGG